MGGQSTAPNERPEGPCIHVKWREPKPNSRLQKGRFFPRPDQNETAAEAACFEWFCARRCIVESMVWSWGPIPPSVTRTQRVLLP